MIVRVNRKVALWATSAVICLLAGAFLALRSRWAGDRLCEEAERRVLAATGVAVHAVECRVDPVKLEVSAREVRVDSPAGRGEAPLFAADAVRARFRPLQAIGKRLELAELDLVRPRIAARLPPAGGARPPRGACPPPALSTLDVRELRVEGGAVDLTLPSGDRLRIERLDVQASPGRPRAAFERLRGGARRETLEVWARGARLDGARSFALDEAHAAAEVTLDLGRLDLAVATAELPGASVALSGTVESLCDPRLDLAVWARGEVPALLASLGSDGRRTAGSVEAELSVKGPAAKPVVDGRVRLDGVDLDGWKPGDASARLRFAGSELRVEELDIPSAGGRVRGRATLTFGGTPRLDAEATLERVELGEILARLQLQGAWVMARVSGKVRASGTLSPLALAGRAGLDVEEFRVLDHAWERYRPGERTVLDLARARVDGDVRIDREGVRIDAAKVRVGAGALATRGVLYFQGHRGFQLACEGKADLTELRHIASVPVAGLAALSDVQVAAAPYGNPTVRGRAAVRGLHFLQLDLGEAAADLAYDRFVLRARGVDGRRGSTRYQAEVAVDLGASPPRVRDGRYAVQGRLRDVFEAAMPWLPEAVHARDALDAPVALSGTAEGPATALDATFAGTLGPGALAGRRFDAGRLSGHVERGAAAVFEEFELTRGAGVARAAGRVGFAAPHPWSFQGSYDDVALAELQLPGPRWTGAVSGTAALRGSWDAPVGTIALEGGDLVVGEVPLGAAHGSARLEGGVVTVDARTKGVRVDGTVRAAGDMPFALRVELDLENAMRFVPGGPPAGLSARVRGAAVARGKLADLASVRGQLQLDAARFGYGDFQVDQARPLVVTLDEGRAVLAPLEVRGTNTRFTLAGALERSGRLALDVRGGLDLRLLGGLLPGVVDPRGQLLLEAHVGGTLSDPLLVGSGRLRDAGFQMRGLPVVFSRMVGELAFSQNRMLFDAVDASVNGGRARLDGEVELVRFFPARVRVGALLERVPVRIPEWLPSVLSGRLQAAGTWDAMLLSGKLHVLRARYTDPVDVERRIVELRRKKPPPRAFDRAGEWLSFDVALAVDGDVRIENDVARATLAGDLTLTGTLAGLGLVGTLTMREGGRGSFRGNEFVLSHAVVDFSDRRKVRMSLDVHGEAQVRDYRVFMHLFGPYEDPTVELTSQPALTRQDVVTLLSLGTTSRDAAAAGSVSGLATAAAAQAMLTASGLDDKVRRFVPRGSVLRDFNVRITSAYSEVAGQVEPRAEFESTVLDDRFRLRYQAPLAGARGQRAQAEMRLSEHTSAQYQWDNENPDVTSGGDHGVDLKLRWEWND